jgi:hypothetical protein
MCILYGYIDSQAKVCGRRKRNDLPEGIGRRSLHGKAIAASHWTIRHLFAITQANAIGQQGRLRGGRQG